MKKISLSIFSLFFIFSLSSLAQSYHTYFSNTACRIDFLLCGNATTTAAYLDKIKEEPFWGGRRSGLATDLNLGEYRFPGNRQRHQSVDIYRWFQHFILRMANERRSQTFLNKSYEQTIQFPFPKNPVKVTIEKRLDFDKWETLLQFGFSPR